MSMKINQKKDNVEFKQMFESGKLFYGCRDIFG